MTKSEDSDIGWRILLHANRPDLDRTGSNIEQSCPNLDLDRLLLGGRHRLHRSSENARVAQETGAASVEESTWG